MRTTTLLVVSSLSVAAGCSSPSGAPVDGGPVDGAHDSGAKDAPLAHDAPRETGHEGDAGGPADAHVAKDASDAVAPLDARDTGPGDAREDSQEAHDAASDANGHGCTYSGESRGTIDTLGSNGAGSLIADFDIDCQNLFAIDSLGGVASCPASGCGAAPTSVVADGTFAAGAASLRIGTSGLFVLSPMSTPLDEPPKDAGPTPVQLFALGRDGSNAHVVASLALDSWGESAQHLLGQPGFLSFYVTTGTEPGGPSGGPITPLEVYPTGSDAGSFVQFPGSYGGGMNAGPAAGTVSSSGKTEYETTVSIVGQSGITQFNLTGTSTTGVVYLPATKTERFSGVVSSDAFVVWTATPVPADAGAPTTYVCAPTAPCTTAAAVTGLGAFKPLAATVDTLFLTDASGDLATCLAGPLLASGACTPSTLATALPAIGRFQADADNAYILTADGSKILRIAR